MRMVAADHDKAIELIGLRLDRSRDAGNDVERDDYPETISDDDAERIRDEAIADVQDVASAYGDEFVRAILDRKVIR